MAISDEAVEAAARAEWAHDHFVRDWEDAHASDRAHIRRRVRAALAAADAVRSRTEVGELVEWINEWINSPINDNPLVSIRERADLLERGRALLVKHKDTSHDR